MDRSEFTPRFAAALARRRAGPVGAELRATYPRGPTTAVIETFWGDEMAVVLPELGACELERYGLIEPGVTRLFLDVVRRGTVVFDVGAHVGYFSLLASALGARVHAFEPSPSTLVLTKRNLAGRASVVPRGLWRQSDTLELKDFGPRHSAVNTFLGSKDESLTEPQRTHLVDVTSVDEHVAATGEHPQLIKIDAEGAEADVLRGAARTIAAARPIITLEVGDAEGTPPSREALEVAREFGYSVHDLDGAGRSPHRLRDSYSYGNVALIAETPERSESDRDGDSHRTVVRDR